MPSFPKWIDPPLWLVALLRLGSVVMMCGPVVAVFVSAPPNHATTLCGDGFGAVKYTYTRCVVAELGGNAIPRRPRSPSLSTLIEKNGLGRSVLPWRMRIVPPCSDTNRRPSGA